MQLLLIRVVVALLHVLAVCYANDAGYSVAGYANDAGYSVAANAAAEQSENCRAVAEDHDAKASPVKARRGASALQRGSTNFTGPIDAGAAQPSEIRRTRATTAALQGQVHEHEYSLVAVLWREYALAAALCCVSFLLGTAAQRLYGSSTKSLGDGAPFESASVLTPAPVVPGSSLPRGSVPESDADSEPSGSGWPSPSVDRLPSVAFATDVAGDFDQSHLELVGKLWDRFVDEDTPNLFGMKNVSVAKDGGVSDIPNLRVKKLQIIVITATCVANFILIATADLAALRHDGQGTPSTFLITGWIATKIRDDALYYCIKIVPFFELSCLLLLVCRVIGHVFVAIFAERYDEENGERIKWTWISNIFTECIPKLKSFSALQLLYYVSPDVVTSQGHIVLLHAYERSQGRGYSTAAGKAEVVAQLVLFGILRVIALLFGIDAFLLKFRAASKGIDEGRMDFEAMVGTLSFLWQVMGIIQLKWFVSDRLFVFIFAGSDGNMDFDEVAVRDVWHAVLCKRVYEHFGDWRGSAVMLGFDDYDFQRLAFVDDEELIRVKAAEATNTVTPDMTKSLAGHLGDMFINPLTRSVSTSFK